MKRFAIGIIILALLILGSVALLKQESTSSQEHEQWRTVKLLGSKAAYENFLKTYPESFYRDQAISAINNLPFHARLNAGQSFTDCLVCPDMVVIPEGQYQRGPEQGDEQPIEQVTISQPLAISRFEITYEQWMVCANLVDACSKKTPSYPVAAEMSPDLPIVDITWNDAQQYVQWLSDVTGFKYRLLTEAEWEYAARAGSTLDYSWGDELPLCVRAAYNGALFDDGSSCSAKAPVNVGSFLPNAFGLYDMHGTVWEWVQDCYQDSYEGVPVDGSSLETCQDDNRVLRGGAYSSNPHYLRSANRNWTKPDDKSYIIGFRVARELDLPSTQ